MIKENFDNLSIRKKLTIMTGIVTGSIITILFLVSYLNQIIIKLEEERVQSGVLQIQILQLRRAEKDFLTRKDLTNSELFNETYASLSKTLLNLETIVDDAGLNKEMVPKLTNAIETYKSSFDNIVALQQKIGLDEKSGLHGSLRKSAHEIEKRVLETSNFELGFDLLMVRRQEKDFILRNDLRYLASFETEFQKAQERLGKNTEVAEFQIKEIESLYKEYGKHFRNLVNGMKQLGLSADQGLKGTMRNAIHQTDGLNSDLQEGLSRKIAKDQLIFTVVVILISIVFIVLIVLFFRAISTSIVRPVNNMAESLQRLSTGDLSVNIEMDGTTHEEKDATELERMSAAIKAVITSLKIKSDIADHIAKGHLDQDVTLASASDVLGISFKTMVKDLSQVFLEIKDITNEVNNGAKELSDSAGELANGTSKQASSLEEISSSMEEVGKRSQHNSSNADEASKLTGKTLNVVENGNRQMNEMLTSMENISSTSSNITKIIKVIDEIAFQTNLLALNAAVEAARAGKYGKGFAVVADEVRSLAVRSAEAAKDTTDLIESSVDEVEKGVNNAGKTAEILNEISDSINKVNDLIGEITVASRDQTLATSQISEGLVQINEVVQQNSSVSEETASASEELSRQALQLQVITNRFTLKNERVVSKALPEEPRDKVQLETPVQAPELEFRPKPVAPRPKVITLDDENFGKY